MRYLVLGIFIHTCIVFTLLPALYDDEWNIMLMFIHAADGALAVCFVRLSRYLSCQCMQAYSLLVLRLPVVARARMFSRCLGSHTHARLLINDCTLLTT